MRYFRTTEKVEAVSTAEFFKCRLSFYCITLIRKDVGMISTHFFAVCIVMHGSISSCCPFKACMYPRIEIDTKLLLLLFH